MGLGPTWPNISQYQSLPTDAFMILEAQDKEMGDFYVVRERRVTGFKA